MGVSRGRGSGRGDEQGRAAHLSEGVDRGFFGFTADDTASGIAVAVAPLGAVAVKEIDFANRKLEARGGELAFHPFDAGIEAPVRRALTARGVEGLPSGRVELVEGEIDSHGPPRLRTPGALPEADSSSGEDESEILGGDRLVSKHYRLGKGWGVMGGGGPGIRALPGRRERLVRHRFAVEC